MVLRIAARQSDLARLQAYQVGDRLTEQGFEVQYNFRESLGDINQDDPLWKMPEKGVFTEDFREGLIQGQWDMVVHSWKDLPVEILEDTQIVATLPRADARDLLLLKKSHLQKIKDEKSVTVFSSSPRRVYNLTPFFKDHLPGRIENVSFENVRGNILTRVGKLMANSEVDGLIVAKAAIDRLLSASKDEFQDGKNKLQAFLNDCLWQVLPLKLNPTAAAQGALAVEIKSDRQDLQQALQKIHCPVTFQAVSEERQILKGHGGGCHQKIGVSRVDTDYGTITWLRGETEQGEVLKVYDFRGQPFHLKNPFLGSLNLFDRKPLAYQFPKDSKAHFIGRSSALPEGENGFSQDDVIWVSGLRSWKKLAKRGYWVNGCSESLGEAESQRLETLMGGATQWTKWTHSDGHGGEKKVVPTYQLIPRGEIPKLKGFTEFFWMSGSQFERAIELEPEVLNARHFCGAGHTYTKICEILKDKGIESKPTRLPGYEVWLNATKEFENETNI